MKNLEDALNSNEKLQQIGKNSDKTLKETINTTQRAFTLAYQDMQRQVASLKNAINTFMGGIESSSVSKGLQAKMKALDESIAHFTKKINSAIQKLEDFLNNDERIQSLASSADKTVQETINNTKHAFVTAAVSLKTLADNVKDMLEGLDQRGIFDGLEYLD